MAEVLYENATIAKDKIVVAGIPRFDFYHHPLRAILDKPAFLKKYSLDPRYPVITLATNFTQASFCTANQDFYFKNAQKHGFDKVLDKLFGDAGDIPKRDYLSRELFLNAFVALVKNYPEVNFVLKLHPSEDHQFYQNLIREELPDAADRVRIIAHEYIWDVLNATDIELNRSCTTAIESWMLGKPTIEMQLNPEEFYFSAEFSSGSDLVRSTQELIAKVSHYLAGGEIPDRLQQARKKFLQTWCNSPDGDATRIVVEHIHRLLRTETRAQGEQTATNWQRWLNHYLLTLGDYFGHDLKVYGLKNTWRRNYVDKLGRFDKYIHQRDVKGWKRRLSPIIAENPLTPRVKDFG